MKVVLNTENIQLINVFQNLTGSHVLDCVSNEEIYFVVSKGQYGLAVGKKGMKIKNAERVLKKRIKVFEYSDNLEDFIKNLVPEARQIKVNNKDNAKTVEIKIMNPHRARVIGKGGKNIKVIKHFLERLYDVNDVKIR